MKWKGRKVGELFFYIILFAGVLVYIGFSWISAQNRLEEDTLKLCRSIESTLPTAIVKMLDADSSDVEKPEYQILKNSLKELIKVNTNARFAYLYTQKNGKIFFLVDSEPEDSKDYSPPGQEYIEASKEDIQPFIDGKELLTSTHTDRWGTWRSILIPVKDQETGEILAIFGMDFDVRTWQKIILLEVFHSILPVLLVLVLLVLFKVNSRNKVLNFNYKELEKAKDALAESEERFKVITQSTLDIIFIVDITGKQLFFNESVETTLGYSIDELIGKPFTKFVPNSELPKYFARLKDIFLNKPILNFTTKIYHKEGHLVDVEINGRLVRINGELVGQGTIRDITERKAMTESLKVSLTKYQVLFDTFPVGISITNAEGKIIETNKLAEEIMELPKEIYNDRTLSGQEWNIVRPDGTKMPSAEFPGVRALNENRTIRNVEMGVVKSEDATIWINASATPIPLQDYGAAIVYNDVSEKKQTELALKQEQFFTQTLLDSLPGIFYLYTYPELELVRWNKNYETVLGYTIEELKKLSVKDWMNSKTKAPILEAMQKAGEQGSFAIEAGLFTKDRREIPFILSAVFFELNEQQYIMGVGFDSSELKRAEEEIKSQNIELKRVNAEKDKFFSIIAHDLRAPFNSILGFSELLIEQVENYNPEELSRFARIIINSSKHSMELLQNLMEWSQTQTGRMNFNPSNFDLIKSVNQIIHLYETIAQKKSISILAELPDNQMVYGDVNMINTIIRNFISNAIKYTNPGGEVTVFVESGQTEITVSVKDNGVGIAESVKDKILRIDTNHSTRGTLKEQGTGLGLLLCSEFAEQHKGKIWFESEEGKGSVFSFSIPVVQTVKHDFI